MTIKGQELEQELHLTCTSTSLSDLYGTDREHVPVDVLNNLHEKQMGYPVSSDLAIARLEREMALVRHKRAGSQSQT